MAARSATDATTRDLFPKELKNATSQAQNPHDRLRSLQPLSPFRAVRRIGASSRKTHDHSLRIADHRLQGRHRRVAATRPDLRDALHRLALREWPEGQKI